MTPRDISGLEAALGNDVDGEVRFDAGSRGAYVTDGSNYRQVPLGVVVPRTVEAAARAVAVCARFDVPVLSRGSGTSLAGQTTNTAVVIDWTKYCDRLVSVDPDARTCVVEPGIVLDALNHRLGVHRLQFGPKPSTHDEPDPADPRTVVLWPDTFSTYFHPSIAKSALRVLEDAGFRVAVPAEPVCCGLTWISTGQLPVAEKVLRRTLDVLRPYLDAGTPVIGLEPSCTAVFRSDAPELLPADQDVRRLAGQVRTFAEQLVHHAPDDWRPPRLGRHATVQTHCHQHAIMKFDDDRELMRRAHLDAEVLDEGCCGLAGNFGFERGHHEVSKAVGEQGVLPAVRAADPGSLVLADGFSCRTQIEQGGTGRRALHLAEVLALALDGNLPSEEPERLADRPHGPSRVLRWATTASAVGLVAAAGTGAARRLR
ncbi:FAD-binding and (Fe-S)-binding domain-containing protein, partial [Streptomyces collinus]